MKLPNVTIHPKYNHNYSEEYVSNIIKSHLDELKQVGEIFDKVDIPSHIIKYVRRAEFAIIKGSGVSLKHPIRHTDMDQVLLIPVHVEPYYYIVENNISKYSSTPFEGGNRRPRSIMYFRMIEKEITDPKEGKLIEYINHKIEERKNDTNI